MSGWFGRWANMAIALLVAVWLASILRPATAQLSRTLGTVWPFSTVHCNVPSAPGCEPDRGAQIRLARR